VCNPDLKTDHEKFLELAGTPSLHLVVKEGDMLYLPALWYHQVSQYSKNPNDYIVAVNHWFDMDFGHNHGLYQLSRLLAGFN
jgi:jumonji domain-containing protein 7